QTIHFMVSCRDAVSYRADIVRLICGDDNPDGPGFKEEPLASPVSREYPGRTQETRAGSFVIVPHCPAFERLTNFTLAAFVWPTTPSKGRQAIVAKWVEAHKSGFALTIEASSGLTLSLGDGQGRMETLSTGIQLLSRRWYFVAACFDEASREVRVLQ